MSRTGKVQIAILVFLTIWFLLTVIAPFTIPANSVRNLTGVPGRIDNADVTKTMNPLAQAIYTTGDAYCNQISSHSYYLNGNQMPFCSRCEGIFLGLVVGMVIAIITGYEITAIVLVLGITPIAVDGLMQLLTRYVSINPIRVVTGLLAGIVVSLLISLFVRETLGDSKSPAGTKEDKPVRNC